MRQTASNHCGSIGCRDIGGLEFEIEIVRRVESRKTFIQGECKLFTLTRSLTERDCWKIYPHLTVIEAAAMLQHDH
jgi:hypothetical protein